MSQAVNTAIQAVPPLDVAAIVEENMRHVIEEGQVVELRALGTAGEDGRFVRTGYFDNAADLARAAATLDGRVKGVYFTLNALKPELLERAPNRLDSSARSASDRDVLRRRWLPLDFDPVRPAGVNATDDEVAAAMQRAEDVWLDLRKRGWPEPVAAFSGNGWHLLFPFDRPADDDQAKRVLQAFSKKYSDDKVTLDAVVHNPSRIWKCYGTLACKGPQSIERPYRRAVVIGKKEWA